MSGTGSRPPPETDEASGEKLWIAGLRSGFFSAGRPVAAAADLVAGDMLDSLRSGGATELPGRKVASVAPRCLTTAPRPQPLRREFYLVRDVLARLAGFEPATRCLEGRFRQGVNLHLPRQEATQDVHM